MQKKSNPFDLVNIISVVLGIVMIAVFIVWGNKRLEAVPSTGTTATAGAAADAPAGAPGVGGMAAPSGLTAPGGSTAPAAGGPMLPMGGSSSAMPPTPGQ